MFSLIYFHHMVHCVQKSLKEKRDDKQLTSCMFSVTQTHTSSWLCNGSHPVHEARPQVITD